MAVTLNALTTGVGGLQTTADTSGQISLQSNGSTVLAMTGSGVAVTGTMTVGGNSVLNAGTTVTSSQGGTGLTSFTSGGAMYATSTSALTTGTLPVASGGTGATSLTANNVILGNGTSAVQFVAPGSNGNLLTSNGTTWTSAAPPSSTPTTAQVLSALTGMTANVVGSICAGFTNNVTCAIGGTMAGSNLRGTSSTGTTLDPGFSGTWLNLGTSAYGSSNYSARSTWVRIS
jgi:hypothetical protein